MKQLFLILSTCFVFAYVSEYAEYTTCYYEIEKYGDGFINIDELPETAQIEYQTIYGGELNE